MIEKLKTNPRNPRRINKDEYKKLKQSIRRFPQMLTLRPIVYDKNNIVLGGNMRLKALHELAKEGREGGKKDCLSISLFGMKR